MKTKLLATAAALLMATGAQAVVVTFSTPIVVPPTFDGVYINLLTGATGTTSAAVPGWAFNPYNQATAPAVTLNFFWASSAGGVASTTTGPYLSLAPGAIISGSSTQATTVATAATAAFATTGPHILGFRFLNEATNAVNFGYLTMVNTGPAGFPATITGWSFENSGGAITVPGAGVIPEPESWMMMIAGFGLAGSALRYRRRKTRVSFG